MSAWIVSRGHIDALVQSLIAEGLVPMSDASSVGRELWEECRRSVAYRYPNDADGEWPGPNGLTVAEIASYRFAGIEAPLDDVIIYHQWTCYGYQSCEHDAWTDARAHDLLEECSTLIAARHGGHAAMSELTDRRPRLPWGVDSVIECVAS